MPKITLQSHAYKALVPPYDFLITDHTRSKQDNSTTNYVCTLAMETATPIRDEVLAAQYIMTLLNKRHIRTFGTVAPMVQSIGFHWERRNTEVRADDKTTSMSFVVCVVTVTYLTADMPLNLKRQAELEDDIQKHLARRGLTLENWQANDTN